MELEVKEELLSISIALKTNIESLCRLFPISDGIRLRKEFGSVLEVYMLSIHEFSCSQKGRSSLIMASITLVSLENVLFRSLENGYISNKCYTKTRDKLYTVNIYLRSILALETQPRS